MVHRVIQNFFRLLLKTLLSAIHRKNQMTLCPFLLWTAQNIAILLHFTFAALKSVRDEDAPVCLVTFDQCLVHGVYTGNFASITSDVKQAYARIGVHKNIERDTIFEDYGPCHIHFFASQFKYCLAVYVFIRDR